LVNHEGNTSNTVLHIMLTNQNGSILKYGIGNYAGQWGRGHLKIRYWKLCWSMRKGTS